MDDVLAAGLLRGGDNAEQGNRELGFFGMVGRDLNAAAYPTRRGVTRDMQTQFKLFTRRDLGQFGFHRVERTPHLSDAKGLSGAVLDAHRPRLSDSLADNPERDLGGRDTDIAFDAAYNRNADGRFFLRSWW